MARALRKLAVALLALLGAAALLLAGVRLWLETGHGERFVARQVTERASAAIEGELSAGRVGLDGLSRITAEEVLLRSPEGEPIARAARLSAGVSVRELLRGGPIVLRGLRVEGLVLDVVVPEDGPPDLLRALRTAGPAAPDEGGPAREIALLDARLGIDRLAVRRARGAPPLAASGAGELEGDVRIAGDRLAVDARGRLALEAPVAGPLALDDVRLRLEGGRLERSGLAATLPGSVELEARTAERAGSDAAPPAHGPVPPLEVSLEIPAEGLVPYGGPPLGGAAGVRGTLSLDAGRVDVRATVRPPGPGEVRIAAALAPGEPRELSLLVDARGIDPARLRAEAPAGRLWAALRVRGAAALPPGASLSGTFWLAPSELLGERLGPGRARVAVRGARIAVNGLDVGVPGGRVRGRLAAGGDAPPVLDLRASLSRVEALVAAARSLGAGVPDAAGMLDARARVAGAGASRGVSVELASPSLTLGGRALADVDAAARLEGAALGARIRARTADGPLAVDLRGALGEERVRIRSLALAAFGTRWRLDRPTVVAWGGGRLAVRELALRGPGALRVDAVVPTGEGAARRPLRADVVAEAVPLAVLELLRSSADRAPAPADRAPSPPAAAGGRGGGEGAARRLLPDGVADARLRLRGTLRAPDVELDVGVRVRAREEHARAELSLRGTRARAEGQLLVDVNGVPAARVDVALRAAPGRDLASSEGLLAARLDATATVPTLDAGVLARLGVPLGSVRGTLQADLTASGPLGKANVAGDVRIADVVVLDHPDLGRLPPLAADLRLDATGGGLEASVAAGAPGVPPIRAAIRIERSLPEALRGVGLADAPLEGRIEVPRGRLALHRLATVAGAVEARVFLGGTVAEPSFEAVLAVDAVEVDGAPLGSARVEASGTREGGRLALRAAPEGGGSLVAEAEARPGAPWRAVVEARRASLDALRFLPQAGAVEGALADGRLELRGGASPSAAGELRLEARRLPLDGYGTFRNVAIELHASEARVELRRAAAELLGGRAEATGEIAWGEGGARAAVRVETDAFPVPRELRPLGELTTRADVTLALEGRSLEGTIALSPGEVRLAEGGPGELHPTSLPPTYVVHESEEAERRREEPRRSGFAARVRITVPRDFWVRSDAANLEVTADLVARLEEDRLSLTGGVQVPRGSLSVLSRKFEVERLALTFGGDPEIDPALDGRLSHEQPSLRVWIDLSGRLREPEVALSSEPPMDPDQIALAVAAGRTVEPGAGLSGSVMAGALNVVAGEVGQALTENLPIDVLEVELGPGGEARRLEAGTYLTPRLFLSFVRNVFALPDENENEVRAEYQLGRNVSLSSRYGDRQSGALNLLWERRFRSGAQRAAGVEPATAAEAGAGSGSLGGGDR